MDCGSKLAAGIRGKGLTSFVSPKTMTDRTFFVPPVCGSGTNMENVTWQKSLPPRPNLDHLRRQAESAPERRTGRRRHAVAVVRDHSTRRNKGMTPPNRFFVSGDSAWRMPSPPLPAKRDSPVGRNLARHVEQLRALEGTWVFAHLEVDGHAVPQG